MNEPESSILPGKNSSHLPFLSPRASQNASLQKPPRFALPKRGLSWEEMDSEQMSCLPCVPVVLWQVSCSQALKAKYFQ